MLTFRQYISEKISAKDLKGVEDYADKLFKALGIDVEFGGGGQHRSFLDMLNDKRNVKTISRTELSRLFKLTFQKHGKTIQRMPKGAEAVITDMETDINMPFGIKPISNKGKGITLQLYTKTIMRTTDFKPNNPRDKLLPVGKSGAKARVSGRGSHKDNPEWDKEQEKRQMKRQRARTGTPQRKQRRPHQRHGGKKQTNRTSVVRGGHKPGTKYSDNFRAQLKARLRNR